MRSITNKTQFYYLLSIALHTLCAAYFLFNNSHVVKQTQQAVDFILVPFEEVQPIASVNKISQTIIKSKIVSETPDATEKIADIDKNSRQTESLTTTQTGTISGTLAQSAEQKYIALVRQTLERNKKYPTLAKKMGHSGQVIIKFEIAEDGKVIQKSIETPSEYESLNQSALKLLDQVHQFEKFPVEIRKQKWTFVLPIEYKL